MALGFPESVMPGKCQILSLVIVLGCGVLVAADEAPPVEYQKAEIALMRALSEARTHLNQKDFPSLAADAAMLRVSFDEVERYWSERDAADATAFARAGATAARDLQRRTELNDHDGARKAFEVAASTCRGCHQAYAQPDGEGGFVIGSNPTVQRGEVLLAALPDDVHRPGRGGITLPRLIQEVKPSYTPEAMRVGLHGSVLLTCTVLPDGTVSDVNVLRSLDPVFGLDREAVRAAQQWRFAPGTNAGAPVKVRVTIELPFSARSLSSRRR
jgi:TonB family protein